MDILLNDSGDILFTNTDIPAVTAEQRQDVAQRLQIKLRTVLGEWFLNTDVGVPYYQQIFGKNRSKFAVDIIFQTLIKEEPDVLEIVSFESSLDPSTRAYTLNFRVRVAAGTTDVITI